MGKKILIVDDSPTLRKVIRLYLERNGFNVSEANNGQIALDMLERNNYCLLILDMNMPVLNGAGLISRLKEKEDYNIPILVLSADKKEKIVDSLSADFQNYYIQKPFRPKDIVLKIEEIFNS